MQTLSVVKDLNIIEDILLNHLNCSIFFLINTLFFHICVKAFHATVVIRIACLAHASGYLIFVQFALIFFAAVLTAPVRMKQQFFGSSAFGYGISQCPAMLIPHLLFCLLHISVTQSYSYIVFKPNFCNIRNYFN